MPIVGALTARLSLNSTAFTRGLRSAGRDVTLFGQTTRTAGSMVREFANSLVAATGPILGFAGLFRGLRIAEGFQQEMNSSLAIVKDVTPAMRQEMESLTKDLAFELKYSATELAKGYYYLFSAGLDVQRSMEALPVTARFAQAGMADLATSTKILLGSLSALGLNQDPLTYLENLTAVGDMLAMASRNANNTIVQFGEALTNKAAARMKILKIPLAEGIALLQAFAEQAKEGTDIGTAFDIVLRDLTKAAITNADAFRDNQIRVFDEWTGELATIPDLFASLEQAFAGLSAKAATEKLMDLGLPSKSAAYTAMVIGMSGQMRKWTEANRAAGGTLDDIASKQLPAFTKAWNKVKAVMESVAIVNLTPWLNSLGNAVDLLLSAERHYGRMAESASIVKTHTNALVTRLAGLERIVGMIADGWQRIRLGLQMANTAGYAFLTIMARLNMIGTWNGDDLEATFARLTDEAYKMGEEMAGELKPSQRMELEKMRRQMTDLRKEMEKQTKLDLQPGKGALEDADDIGKAFKATAEDIAKANRLVEEFATPIEKANKKIEDLNRLWEVGALKSLETYRRAYLGIMQDLAKATMPEIESPDLVRAGTQEAIEVLRRTRQFHRQMQRPASGIGTATTEMGRFRGALTDLAPPIQQVTGGFQRLGPAIDAFNDKLATGGTPQPTVALPPPVVPLQPPKVKPLPIEPPNLAPLDEGFRQLGQGAAELGTSLETGAASTDAMGAGLKRSATDWEDAYRSTARAFTIIERDTEPPVVAPLEESFKQVGGAAGDLDTAVRGLVPTLAELGETAASVAAGLREAAEAGTKLGEMPLLRFGPTDWKDQFALPETAPELREPKELYTASTPVVAEPVPQGPIQIDEGPFKPVVAAVETGNEQLAMISKQQEDQLQSLRRIEDELATIEDFRP